MKVTVYAEQHRGREGYQGAELELPAGRFAAADAFQRAHMPEAGGYYMARFTGWPPFLGRILAGCGAEKLEELNLLAWKAGQMDEEQLAAYEGAVAMRQNGDIDTPVTVRELINILYNLDSYTFHPGLLNDRMLGEMCLMGKLPADLGTVPDEVFGLLSEEKVGEYMRRSGQGEFTDKGYILRGTKEWREVYDGEHLPEQPDTHDGLISLRIESEDSMMSGNNRHWLELPADRKDMERMLASLGERSFDQCATAEIKSILPLYGYEPMGDLYIGKLNLLAKRMAAFPDSGALAKYMAAVEMDGRHDLDRMLDIAENLECYDFDRGSPADYGKYLLEEMGADTADPAFERFDFSGYGTRRLEASGFCCTPYGSVGRNGLPFVQEYSDRDAAKEGYKLAEIDSRIVLFTNMRIDRDTVPDGIFCYDVLDSDSLDGSFAEVKPYVTANHWRTILSREKFPMNEYGSYYPEVLSYLDGEMGLTEFQAATPGQLAAHLPPEPPSEGMKME